MTFEVFTQKLGDAPSVWPTDTDEQAELAVKVLDAVQVIVDVLVDEGVQYEASFAATGSAYTDHQRRRIAVSAKPLLEGGRPLDEVAAIIAGFVVHEIGHTKERERELGALLKAEWPGKVTPHRLSNILSDVRLEATAIARFAGLRDVFVPTMVWVAEATCPTHDIAYGKTLHERINFVGQAVRYAPFVSFAADEETQRQLRWWQEWGAVDATTDNETMLRLVREGIERIKQGAEYEPEPPVEDGQGGGSPDDEPSQGTPDDDLDEPTEGGDGEGEDADGEDGDTEGGDDDTEGDADGDGNGDGEADDEDDESESEGGSETDAEPLDGTDAGGSAESDDESDGEGEDGDTEGEAEDGESNGEAEGGDHVLDGQLGEGETLDREESDDENVGDGAGGSGKTIGQDSDVDEGLVEDKLDKTQDELTEGDRMEQYRNEHLQQQVDEERSSSRIDAGAFGKMKVRVQL